MATIKIGPTDNLQSKINSSANGDTLEISGAFNLGNVVLNWLPERKYISNGAAITANGVGTGEAHRVRGNNVTVDGFVFKGGGFFCDSPNGMNVGLTFNNNEFYLNTSGSNPNGITATSGLQNSKITNNLFTGYGSSFGIYGYNYNNLVIANNEFLNITAGIHIDAFVNSGNLLVEQNYIAGTKGMGMEFQSTATNLIFQDNHFENPNLSTDPNKNSGCMAFSLILDKSRNIRIRRNTVIAPQKPDGIGCRVGFEVGGDDSIVEDNYVNGINHVLACNDGVDTCSVIARNNRFMNYKEGPRNSFPGPNRTFQDINNGPNVALTWDINRGKPGRNRRLGDTTMPTPPAPTYTPAPVPPGNYVWVSDLPFVPVSNGWGTPEKDMSNGETASGDGKPIRLGTLEYKKGIGCHANATINVPLNGKYDTFLSDIGVDEEVGNAGAVVFQVLADGQKLFESPILKGSSPTSQVSVDVKGKQMLSLVVTDAGDGTLSDHADWAHARLVPSAVPVPVDPNSILEITVKFKDGTLKTFVAK